jgi:hypothetical protein
MNRVIQHRRYILVTGLSILVYIFIETQQMHQNYHFIVMLSQMILTSYLYVSVRYRENNNGISSEVAPISIVTLWI